MTVIEAAHSPLGPSSAERWINCPGSVKATHGLPDTDSLYSLEGTAAHTLSEMARIQNVPAEQFLGTMIPVKKVDGTFHEFEVTREMADNVQIFIDETELTPGDAFFEVRVRYDAWVPGAYGTADDIRISDAVGTITDLKYGKGIQVYAKDNEQLKLYALAVLHDYGYLYNLQEFTCKIVQPRLGHIDSFSITKDELVKWADEVVQPAAALAMSDDAPFKAGEWCQWCKIKATCRVRADHILKQVGDNNDFDDLTVATIDDPKKVVLKPVALMTNDEIGKVGHLLDQIKGWCKDVSAFIMSQIQQGHAVGDWKLVAGRSNRAWGEEPEIIEKKLYAIKVDGKRVVSEDTLYKKKINGPPAIEKVIGKKHPLMQPIEKGGLVSKPPGKPKLAPGTDPRPPLTIDALKEFENLDEQETDNDE